MLLTDEKHYTKKLPVQALQKLEPNYRSLSLSVQIQPIVEFFQTHVIFVSTCTVREQLLHPIESSLRYTLPELSSENFDLLIYLLFQMFFGV